MRRVWLPRDLAEGSGGRQVAALDGCRLGTSLPFAEQTARDRLIVNGAEQG